MKLIEHMDDKLINMESNIPSSEGLYLKYDAGEGKIILNDNENMEEWFEVEDFKRFIEQLKEFVDTLELEIKK